MALRLIVIVVIYKALLSCGTRREIWSTQWDLNSLVAWLLLNSGHILLFWAPIFSIKPITQVNIWYSNLKTKEAYVSLLILCLFSLM